MPLPLNKKKASVQDAPAAGEGLEPSMTRPKPVVLPLHHPAEHIVQFENVNNNISSSQTEQHPKSAIAGLTLLFLLLFTPAVAGAEGNAHLPTFLKPLIPYFGAVQRKKLEAVYRGDPAATAASLWQKAASKPKDLGPRLQLLFHYRKMGDRRNLGRALRSFRRAVYRNSARIRWRKNLYFYLAWAYGIAGRHHTSIKLHLSNYRSRRWTRNLYFTAYRYLDLGKKNKALAMFRKYLYRTRIYSSRPAYYLQYSAFLLEAGYLERAAVVLRRGARRHPRSEKIWTALLKLDGENPASRRLAGSRGLYWASRNPEMLVSICTWFAENERAAECRNYLKRYWYYYRRFGHAVLYLLQSLRLTILAKHNKESLRLINLLISIRKKCAGRGELSAYNYTKARLLIALQRKTALKRLLDSSGSLMGNRRMSLLRMEQHLASGGQIVRRIPAYFTRTCSGLKTLTLLFREYGRTPELLPYWVKLTAFASDPAASWEFGMLLFNIREYRKALGYLLWAWKESPDSAKWSARISETALLAGNNKTALRFFLISLNRLGMTGLETTLGLKQLKKLVLGLRGKNMIHPAVLRASRRVGIMNNSAGAGK